MVGIMCSGEPNIIYKHVMPYGHRVFNISPHPRATPRRVAERALNAGGTLKFPLGGGRCPVLSPVKLVCGICTGGGGGTDRRPGAGERGSPNGNGRAPAVARRRHAGAARDVFILSGGSTGLAQLA